jgi:hypothetical protein
MWNGNGNNGNGQGGYPQQGYQQQPQQGYQQQTYGNGDDVYGRMNNAREQGGARFPFIEVGRHKLCLVTLEKFQHSSDGPCARGIFEVLESNAHQPGSFVVKIWKLVKKPKYDSQASDAELLAQMCIALKGAPRGYPIGNDIRTLLEERSQEQLARGTMIDCTGVPNKKGNWVNLYWTTVAQTPEQIVQNRQRLEAKGIPASSPQQAQGGAQFQGAPHPQQMAQQYPAQQMAPQQPPMQQGYQMQPGTYTMAPGAQAPQQYAPQQQAPQGGFLAQLPPVQGPPQGAPQQQAPMQGPPQGGNGGRPW